jgi:hypothetical protein
MAARNSRSASAMANGRGPASALMTVSLTPEQHPKTFEIPPGRCEAFRGQGNVVKLAFDFR